MALGALFFVAGTLGLLRFPDVFCRLHALTKADGLGLALICLGASVADPSAGGALRNALIWALVALSGATCGHLISGHARREGDAAPEGRR